jgi:hypothetical protein
MFARSFLSCIVPEGKESKKLLTQAWIFKNSEKWAAYMLPINIEKSFITVFSSY